MSNPVVVESVEERHLHGVVGNATEFRAYFVRSFADLGRLATIEDWNLERSEIDWEMINSVVQEKLSRLTDQIVLLIPNLVWKSGSHRARHILLSSYRLFYRLDGDDFDPVYAGISFFEEDGNIRVSGDLSGSESGRVYFDQGCDLSVAAGSEFVLAAADEVAGRLLDQEKIVIQAIRAPHSRLDPVL
jgi:hypothetical protein